MAWAVLRLADKMSVQECTGYDEGKTLAREQSGQLVACPSEKDPADELAKKLQEHYWPTA